MSAVAVATEQKAPLRAHRLRALRHQASEFGVGPIQLTAWHPRLQVVSGTCDNLSMGGLQIRLPGAVATGRAGEVQVDDWLLGVHVALASGEVVCHSDAVVRHQRLDEIERIADSRRILPQFKEWVSDLRNYLERMRVFLDREEAALQSEDLYTHDQICSQYLAEVGPRIVERVHQASHAMMQILAALTEEEHAVHRAYAQHHLSGLFSASPLLRRAQNKPLGYAGDYEMMNMLYRAQQAEGASLFGKVVNQCAVTETAARANINRIGFLTERMLATTHAAIAEGRIARIASIGCGPAREIEALLESEPALGPHLDIALVDQDGRAIAYCVRKLTPLAQRTGARVHLIRESVRRLLCGGSLLQTLGERDLIYSAGLFDYLSDRSFAALLSAIYGAIAPSGKVLVGNVDVSNPTRYFMEYFLDWFLIHRSRSQLLDKARMLTPTPRAAYVEAEPLGVNLFLAIER